MTEIIEIINWSHMTEMKEIINWSHMTEIKEIYYYWSEKRDIMTMITDDDNLTHTVLSRKVIYYGHTARLFNYYIHIVHVM